VSKFINKQTIEYLKAKQGKTVEQEVSKVRDQLVDLHKSSLNAHEDLLERLGHLSMNLVENQKTVYRKLLEDKVAVYTLIQDLSKKTDKFKTTMYVALGVAAACLITLSILIRIKG
jgi:hypothetical protein